MNDRGPLFKQRLGVLNSFNFKWYLEYLFTKELMWSRIRSNNFQSQAEVVLLENVSNQKIIENKNVIIVIIPKNLFLTDDLLNYITMSCPNLKQLYIASPFINIEKNHSFQNLEYLSIIQGSINSINNITMPRLQELDVYNIIDIAKLKYEQQIVKLRIDAVYINEIDKECVFSLLHFIRNEKNITFSRTINVRECIDFIGVPGVNAIGAKNIGYYLDDDRIYNNEKICIYNPENQDVEIYLDKDIIVSNENIFKYNQLVPLFELHNHIILQFILNQSEALKMHYYYNEKILKIRTMMIDENALIELIKSIKEFAEIKSLRIKLLGWGHKMEKIKKSYNVVIDENIPMM